MNHTNLALQQEMSKTSSKSKQTTPIPTPTPIAMARNPENKGQIGILKIIRLSFSLITILRSTPLLL